MSSIAEKYYGDRNKWQLIAKANPLVDPANMKIGTKLTIPSATASAPAAPAPSAPTTAAGESAHTVGAGDTLISLSRRYYGKDGLWELIYDANRAVIGEDPAALKVGMKLRIPKKPS
jgi:nucleoid-associated protein YgaU